MKTTQTAGLSLFALTMLIVGAVDSVRNLPATALFGTALIFFFIFSAIVFLIPVALVSAELSSYTKDKGGIFHWIHLAFGKKAAFFAIWLQWINTIIWLPTVLSFIAGTATYLIDPNLAQNKIYLVSAILIVFWFLTGLNLKGIHFSARFSSICAVFGMIIPMLLITLLAVIWLATGNPSAIHFTTANLLPDFSHIDNWISLTAIMTSFLGIELSCVHIKNISDPQKTFPKALLISVIIVLTTMILGSLAVAMVLPKEKINLINGVMQSFSAFLALYHLAWITPLIATMILVGTLGGIVSWIISPVKGLLHASEIGFLPPFFAKENKNGAPGRLLVTQAILVSLICLTFLLMPSVNGSYWLLTALSTQLYMMMYVMLFLAAITLKPNYLSRPNFFTIPGGKYGVYFTCALGLIGCAITLGIGFIPPSDINVGGLMRYEIIFISGLFAFVTPVIFFYAYQKKNAVGNSETNKETP